MSFWNRWCASLIGEDTIKRFLTKINTIAE
jgi:hypothetical protein